MPDPYRQPAERELGPRWGATWWARIYARLVKRTPAARRLDRMIALLQKELATQREDMERVHKDLTALSDELIEKTFPAPRESSRPIVKEKNRGE